MSGRLRILVVDDDIDNACSLGELLEIEGHWVRVVHTGEEAIRLAAFENFDISFMDVVLPGLNGVESFMAIRRVRPEARIYMMTGYSVEQLLMQALDGGALGVLEKPFDPEAILQLATRVGPTGLILAPPAEECLQGNIGTFIRDTLNSNGLRCRHVIERSHLPQHLTSGEVLLLDLPAPMLDGVELFKQAQAVGHRAQTVLVPHARKVYRASPSPLADITITGVLNKPFDVLTLLNKLPELAA